MIEVLFTESAAGSMQYAKSAKNIIGSAFGIVYTTDDGREPTPEELAKEQTRVEEEHRKKLKNAVPMEGTARDVACFPLGLSMGSISDPLSDERADFIQSTVLISGPNFSDIGKTEVDTARESLKKVLAAIDDGEPVRIWTSRNPDELCGFCHFLTLLPKNADIRVVELPEYEVRENELLTYSGWGEVDALEMGAFQRLERPLTDNERRYFAGLWRELVRENGPLRAVVNGRLCTVGEDFYDSFILRELEQEPERFHEGRLIGRILGRYQLGIGDSLIALRLEEYISRGMLVPVTTAGAECPTYHRYLKKVKKGNRIDPDDWRLLSVDDELKKKEINPTDGEEIGLHAPYLNHCAFCWTQVDHTRHQYWFVPTDLSCCICEKCYHDFKELFQWRELDGWDIEWNVEE